MSVDSVESFRQSGNIKKVGRLHHDVPNQINDFH